MLLLSAFLFSPTQNCYYWPQLPCDVYATEALLKAFNVPKNLTIMSFYGRGGKQVQYAMWQRSGFIVLARVFRG